MPRSVSGNYTLPLPPVVPNTTILAAWANTTDDDIAVALTDSLDRFGRGGMEAAFRLIDGTETIPAFAFNSETGTGLWREANGIMSVSVQGAKVGQWSVDGYTGAITGAVSGDVSFTGVVTFEGLVTFNDTVTIDAQLNLDTLNCTDDAFFAGDNFFTGPATFDIVTFTDQATFQSLALFQGVVQPDTTSRMVQGGAFLQQQRYFAAGFTSTVFVTLPTATSTIAGRGGMVATALFNGFMKVSGSVLIQNNSVTAGVFTLRVSKNGADFAPDFQYYCNIGGAGGALQSGAFSVVFPVVAGDVANIVGKVAAGMNVDYYIDGPLFEMYSVT